MANDPDPPSPLPEMLEKVDETDILQATLRGTVVNAAHEPGTPGIFLRYADGTLIHLIASDKQIYAAIVAPTMTRHLH